MIEEIRRAIEEWFRQWDAFVETRQDQAFFTGLAPVAIGWKVEDLTAFDRSVMELRDRCDIIFTVKLNGRWITKMHLEDGPLAHNIAILKIMQRRPGSDDALGLDHVDFYTNNLEYKNILAAEPKLESNDEVNGIAEWTSVWFGGLEAKIRTNTVLDVECGELQQVKQEVLKGYE